MKTIIANQVANEYTEVRWRKRITKTKKKMEKEECECAEAPNQTLYMRDKTCTTVII